MTGPIHGPCSLSSLLFEGVWQVWLLELDIDHVFRLGVVAEDLFEVALCSLLHVLVVCLITPFHESIELELLEMVALGTLLGVHRGVLDRWEVDIVFFLSVCKLNLGTLELTLGTHANLILLIGDSLLFANLLVELDDVCIVVVTF